MKGKILFAEDDANLAFVVKDNLELHGYVVEHAPDGQSALSLFSKDTFHLCLLDVMMPVNDGFSVAEEIRKANADIPILFLTARAMKEDRLQGFRSGGDDYITKPFSIEELLMRIAVFLKRTGVQQQAIPPKEEIFCFGTFTFDFRNLTLSSPAGNTLLTQKEAAMLRYFCCHRNVIIKREDILKEVWGDDDYFMGRSMDVFIAKLRKYLKEDTTICIRNVHGVGFQFIAEE